MKKLVRLKPVKEFFFGGDLTFGDIKEYNYIAKSTLFPQQTAILGMLRKNLLKQNGLLTAKIKIESVDDRAKAKELVGSGKFEFKKEEQNFGVIKKISSLFLINKKNRFIKKSGIEYDEEKNSFNEYKIKKDNIGYFLEKDSGVFNGKNDIFSNFVNIDTKEFKAQKDIFTQIEQIGIKKDSEEKGFFKKYSYMLNDDFEFAFYVEFEDADFRFENDFIELGAERSVFEMKVEDTMDWLEYEDENIVLLSPSFIDGNIRELTGFAITQDVNFRFIEYRRFKKENRFKKSKLYKLYERGSVFVDYKPKLLEKINEYKNLQKIGLNITSKEKK